MQLLTSFLFAFVVALSSHTKRERMAFSSSAPSSDALFAAFGSSSSDEEQEPSSADGIPRRRRRVRDVQNGVLAFHEGTERALLLYVQQQLQQQPETTTPTYRRRRVLQLVDDFCVSRHWMMHVGVEKGRLLQDFLRERVPDTSKQAADKRPRFVVVELGTYCGYSLIRMADAILEQCGGDSTSIDFTIFTVDVNPQTQQVARQMVELAGLSDYVSFVLLPTGTSMLDASSTNTNRRLSDQLHRAMRERFGGDDQRQQSPHPIDFLFVDHAKELYLPDVQQLEQGGFLRAGSAVAADNVVFFRLDEYRRYMQQQQAQGVVETRLVSDNVWLEYHSPAAVAEELRHANDPNLEEAPDPDTAELRDGIEFTVYRKNPVVV